MDVSTHFDGKVVVISLAGRIDGTTTAQLEQAAKTLVDGGSANLVLDLQQVDYVSSAGLRTILMAAKRARAAGGGIAMFGLQPAVEEVMATSGFAAIVTIAANETEARDSLNP